MYTRENYAAAKAEIEKRRIDAIETAEQRNKELSYESEKIRKIDIELGGTGLLLFKTACEGGDIEPIRKRNTELMAQRKAELVRLGYPEDYTEVHYTCPVCRDSGYTDIRMCDCMRAELTKAALRHSGLGTLIDRQSFENFSLEYYRGNAKIITEALDEIGVWYTGGVNSPYIWLRCPNGMGSWEFFDLLLTKANVVGTPGAGFGEMGEGFFRLTAFGDRARTKEAAERIKKLF